MLTALAITVEWERGAMEQLFYTPIRAREFILGKLQAFREPANKGETMHHLANGYTPEQEALIAAYFSRLGKGGR